MDVTRSRKFVVVLGCPIGINNKYIFVVMQS